MKPFLRCWRGEICWASRHRYRQNGGVCLAAPAAHCPWAAATSYGVGVGAYAELAVQVSEAVQRYGKELRIGVLAIYGGQAMGPSSRRSGEVEVIVATPGRALDHLAARP